MDNKVLKIILSVFRGAVIALGVILCIIIAGKSVSDETYMEGMANYGVYLNIVYGLTLALGVLCVIAAVAFGIVYFLGNIRNNVGMLVGIVGFLIIALISIYGLAGDEIIDAYTRSGEDVTPQISRLSGGGIIIVYILSGIAVLSIVWTEVSRIFK
jgi:tellurite resistance protein TehA-like permease